MSSFPKVSIPETEKNKAWYEAYADAIVNYHTQRSTRFEKIRKIYQSYNGEVRQSLKKIHQKKYDQDISTELINYKLGRTKIQVLKGEFIDIDLQADVTITNPDGLQGKAENAKILMGASTMKEDFDQLKQVGINPLYGAEIPSRDDPKFKDKVNPKIDVEKSMQIIIDKKIEEIDIKMKLLENWVQLMLNAETHGCVFRNKDGIDDYKVISAEDAIFQENENDPRCLKSPFHGHMEYMLPEDIVATWPKMGDEAKKRINELEDDIGLTDHKIAYKQVAGRKVFAVYIMEWKAPVMEVRKTSPTKKSEIPFMLTVHTENYEKNTSKYEAEEKTGKYKIEKKYRERWYGCVRVGADIYFDMGPRFNTAYGSSNDGKYNLLPNYRHILYDSIAGERLSIYELMQSVSELYDTVMFVIASEINKFKGMTFVYDEAYKPKLKSMKSVLYDMVEHNVIRINSAADGNFSERDLANAANVIKQLDLGLTQSFDKLLGLKANLEYTMDRLTGINEAREGLTKPTQSATGAVQNLEASRSITRDLFYFMESYIDDVLTLIAEKTKINHEYLKSLENIAFGTDTIMFLKDIENIPFHSFLAKLTGGKADQNLKDRIRQYFPGEINSSAIRISDIIKYEREKNINLAIKHLDDGYAELARIASQSNISKEKMNEQKIQSQIEMAREDREDVQAHEKELKILDTQGKLMVARSKTNNKQI